MAYTAPTTRTTGTLITSSIWNSDIKDTREYMYSPPSVKAYRSSNQSISASTFTTITYDSEFLDSDTLHSTSTNTDRLTASDAGVYLIWGQVRWAAVTGTSRRQLAIELNATSYISYRFRGVTNLQTDMNISTLYKLAAADYVTLEVWQNSAGALNVLYNSIFPPMMGMQWIGSGT